MAGPAAEKYVLIDDFLLDCALKENHTFDSEVTDYPVESGSSITDNIRPRPITVEIEGLITNTPIGQMVENRLFEGDSDKLPTIKIYDRLQKIRDNRRPVTISTSLRTYDNMALKGLTIPRGDHFNDMKFTASFQQIQTVENKRSIRVSTPIATGGTGKGNKNKTVSKPPEDYTGRTILIDRRLGIWWDPDLVGWRHYAKWGYPVYRRVAGDAIITTYGTEKKWLLFRGAPRTFGTIDARYLTTQGGILLNAPNSRELLVAQSEANWIDVMAVPFNVCEAQFVIQAKDNTIRTPRDLNPVR